MEVVAEKSYTTEKNGKKYPSSCFRNQKKERKMILGANNYIFCHSSQKAIFKFVMHFNNSEKRLHWQYS